MKNSTKKTPYNNYSLDFFNDVQTSRYVIAKKNSVNLGMALVEKSSFVLPTTPFNINYVDGVFFLWLNNTKIIGVNSKAQVWESKLNYSNIPAILKVNENGEKKILFVLSKQGEVYNGEVKYLKNIISNDHVICRDRLFSVLGDKIIFSEPNILNSGIENITLPYTLETNIDFGTIFEITSFNNVIYVVGEKNIAKIEIGANPLDYKVEKCDIPTLHIIPDSLCVDQNIICFMQRNCLYVYDGKKLKEIPVFPTGCVIDCTTKAGLVNGYYLVAFKNLSTEEKASIAININNGEHFFFDKTYAISKTGGYVVCDDLKIYKFDYFNSNMIKQCVYKSKELTMGTNRLKLIRGIDVESKGEGSVTIRGDFGERTYKFYKSFHLDTNYYTKFIQITFNCYSNQLPLEKVNIKYKILGE